MRFLRLILEVEIPAGSSGNFDLNTSATIAGQTFSDGYQTIQYPHIYEKNLYKNPSHALSVVDVAVNQDVNVGYIDSGYDKVYENLRQMGINVTLLNENDLAAGDLDAYDTIIVGVRGYLARPDLVTANGRLLKYVEDGGNMLVQFHKTREWQPEFAPYEINLSNININDENSHVTVLAPEHGVFNTPNKIGDADWENWFQQRAEWTPKSWDQENYVELISAQDPGQEDTPRAGTWLTANYGKGTYIYSSIVWHLELDNLVPGAYRMMANILNKTRNDS